MQPVSVSDCLVVLLVLLALVMLSLNLAKSLCPSRDEDAVESSARRETEQLRSLAGAGQGSRRSAPSPSPSPWEKEDEGEGGGGADAKEIFAHFLKEFPGRREEIEKCIRCLQELANEIDKTHKDCTIANITASSTGAVSGILTILGLALAPVTAGGSLILSATGMGLGAAAATTGVSAGLCEHFINSKKGKEAQALMDQCEKSLGTLVGQMDLSSGLLPPDKNKAIQHIAAGAQQVPKLITTAQGISATVGALKCIRTNPGLKVLAKRVAAGGTTRVSVRGVKQVEKAFKGTAFAMTKAARVATATMAGLGLVMDAYSIIQDAIHITKGATVEAAAAIRAKATELEEVAQNLSKLYEELRELEE
ncbi:apolipoprotein L6-like isoform X2 [Varanus komodoensis]|uniref:apolipoprotein L6-like isoform X2 n=1 Tax=Varanus komodoensis TaxID=61221 RepID=UPI001CF7BFBB|nr:apolipoprotein L6-like isoform X2 [Varanus komodoensis]